MRKQYIVCAILWVQLLGWTSTVFAQLKPGQFDMELELKYRVGKHYKEEKYYKNGVLDSIYRQWDTQGHKVTEGYYVEGKRHGEWTEWLHTYSYHYIKFTYEHGSLKKIYEYGSWGKTKDSPKSSEHFYIIELDGKNYTEHKILWNRKLPGKKTDRIIIVRKGIMVYTKEKFWRSSGVAWLEEEKKALYDKNGESLGLHKHNKWTIWNKDGTLQKALSPAFLRGNLV